MRLRLSEEEKKEKKINRKDIISEQRKVRYKKNRNEKISIQKHYYKQNREKILAKTTGDEFHRVRTNVCYLERTLEFINNFEYELYQ